MAITYTLIATVAPSSSATLFDFTSIPATYTDLRIVLSARSGNQANQWQGFSFAFNGGTADANVTFQRMFAYNTGSSPTLVADTSAGGFGMGNGTATTTNTFSAGVFYIANYTSANQKKAYYVGGSTNATATTALTIRNTANINTSSAINRITLSVSSSNFASDSSASLYGILKA